MINKLRITIRIGEDKKDVNIFKDTRFNRFFFSKIVKKPENLNAKYPIDITYEGGTVKTREKFVSLLKELKISIIKIEDCDNSSKDIFITLTTN